MNDEILRAWERIVRRRGSDQAVVRAADGWSRTFREIDEGAAAWSRRHLPPGDSLAGRPVVFAEPNGVGWLEIFLALLRAGAVAVPMDASEPPYSQRRAATDLRAAAWWDGGRLVAFSRGRRFRDPAIRLIKLTTGSTGRPRGFPFTAAQLLADGRQVMATMRIGSRDTNYALLPLGHSYGLGNLVVPLLSAGVPMVCGTSPLPRAIEADFLRWKPTVFPSVPPIWKALAASDIAADSLASLRVAISAGAPLSPEVARDFSERFRRRIHAFYGSSETGGITYDRSGTGALNGAVGKPLRGVRCTLLPGGRLRVSSAAVFTFGNPSRSGSWGCWVPPDHVQIDARGRLTLLGRRGTTVKIGGRRVDPGEVAARIRGLPGVRDVWVGAGGASGAVLGAAVVSSRSAAGLRAGLERLLPAWKIPKRWLVVRKFPINARGKTDGRILRTRLFGEWSLRAMKR